ncbi:MAG TPA: serine hydrolase domain-containing protein [Nitrospiraceae bacterium]|nr:serine hydrolase domain-containing protein [Nitrospiraceae bacterium]
MSASDPIASAMQSAVEEGVFPGAVLLVRIRGRVAYHRAFGHAALIPQKEPTGLQTIYDLASLTKPLATATAVLCLVQDGRLSLEDPLHDILEEMKESEIGSATVFHLLNHSSGLPAWRPFYERIAEQDRTDPGFLGSKAARQAVLDAIRHETLESPIGARSLYSDLGFMLLGLLVERLTASSLAFYCRERVHGPLGAEPLFFIETVTSFPAGPCDPPSNFHSVAATENDPWRGRVLRAEVHDENAYAMGGVAGHAGLFGTASAVLAVSGAWLEGYLGRGSFLSPDLVRHFAVRQDRTTGSSWGLGWDTPSAPSSSGSKFSPTSFGHLGYTGTSLWVDPVRELEVVLLSNRVHPTRQNNGIQKFRPLIHDLIYEELLANG